MLKTMVVTGGAGFIGSNFIKYMLSSYDDCRVVCIDGLTYAGNMHNLEDILYNERFAFYRCDISDKAGIESIFSEIRPDCVVNFAAESHVDRSIESADNFIKTNVVGTQVLLDACRKHSVKRFHQVSTDEVYGDTPLESKELFTEESILKPSSPYSASKASADMLTLAAFKTYGLPVTISRCTNNLGPYQFPEKLVPLTILNSIKNEPTYLYGSGENIRDWISTYDHCTAVDIILKKGTAGNIYNAGANNEISNKQLVSKIIDIVGSGSIAFTADRLGHDRRYGVSAEKLKALGWKPQKDINTVLYETVKWYMENSRWLNSAAEKEYLEFNKKF